MTPKWRRYARFWGARVDRDVDDEMRFHIEMLIHDYEARGMSPEDARAAATRRLGNLPGARDACLTIGHRRQRRMARARTLDALMQDIRFALRTLGRQKGWTTVALLTLALGIGASTAMFCVVNSLILHPLSYIGADRVRLVWLAIPNSNTMVSPDPDVLNAWKSAHSLDALEQYESFQSTLSGRGDPTLVQVARINSSFLTLANAPVILGRNFVPDEERPGGEPVALIDEGYWRGKLGASASILGQRLTIDGKSLTIVGVVSSKIQLPGVGDDHVDFWKAARSDTTPVFGVTVARLRPGVQQSDAERELDSIAARLDVRTMTSAKQFKTALRSPSSFIGFAESLYLWAGAVALLLLVACANVAHLMLARGATRVRELAIRAALGAGRGRIVRQLLTESLLLASSGCVLGVGVGYGGVRVLLALRPASLDELAHTQLEWRAFNAAGVLSVITGVVFGLTAALHSIRHTSSDSLRANSLSGTTNHSTNRARSALVVTEMALSAMLLVGAILLVRSVRNLQHVDIHFNATDLYSLRLRISRNRYPTQSEKQAFIDAVVDGARHLPAVVQAAFASSSPPHFGLMLSRAESSEGTSLPTGSISIYNIVTSEYFDVLQLRIAHGRTFTRNALTDDEIMINEGFAQRLWPGETAVGKRLRFTSPGAKTPEPWKTVIGVVTNVPMGLATDVTKPMFYLTSNSAGWSGSVSIIVRARHGVNPTSSLQRLVMRLDPDASPPTVESVPKAISNSIASQRFTMDLIAVFAVLAVVLSAIGLYGVISYVVTQRTREIGIRMALGALPAEVARTIVARGLVLSVIGLSLGLIGAVWGTKLIKSTLFGVTGTDTISYATTGVALLAVSILASLVPMRRAMRVDPVIAMRGE
jgi:putative ABC transport system permease protein